MSHKIWLQARHLKGKAQHMIIISFSAPREYPQSFYEHTLGQPRSLLSISPRPILSCTRLLTYNLAAK